MKPCPACAAELDESAAVCHACGHLTGAASVASHPAGPEVSSGAPAAAAESARSGGWSRRELTLVVAALFFGGALTMALLVMRSAAPQQAAAAPGAAAASNVARPAAPSVSANATWSTENVDRWIGNGRRKFAIELAAENQIGVWQRQVRPVLVVRCLAQRPEVFVFTDSPAKIEPKTEDHTVRIAFDDSAEESARWPDSADHDALFAPDGLAFARRLSAARTMRFGFTPHNAPAAVVIFNVAGLAGHLDAAAGQCGWTR